jgi:membrane fusion protein (multidrug efflux system)
VAPIDGIAGIANAQVGDLIGPQSTNPLTTISTVDPILVNFTASEEEYLNSMANLQRDKKTIEQGLRTLSFNLELADGKIFPHKGRFYALDRQVDLRTGTILVQVQMPNPEKTLRPGGFGRINTVVRIQKDALMIPQRAVTDVQGQYLVAVVGSNNKVSIRKVTAGPRVGSMWIINEGLKPGDRVVAEGTQKVARALPWFPNLIKAKQQGPAN